MKTYLFFVSLVTVLSCSDNLQVNDNLIFGTWHDVEPYEESIWLGNDGQRDTLSYPNILYHFFEDGTYEVENEIPWGLVENGVWQIDECTQIITFIPDIPNEVPIGDRTFKFEILSLSETELEVMYHYYGAPLEADLEPVEFSFYRKFEKL